MEESVLKFSIYILYNVGSKCIHNQCLQYYLKKTIIITVLFDKDNYNILAFILQYHRHSNENTSHFTEGRPTKWRYLRRVINLCDTRYTYKI